MLFAPSRRHQNLPDEYWAVWLSRYRSRRVSADREGRTDRDPSPTCGRTNFHGVFLVTERQIYRVNGKSNRRWMALCGTSMLALGTTLVSGTWAWDDAKPVQPAGLRGVLPIDVPATLGEDAFAVLDGNWKEWGEKTAAEVAKLYSSNFSIEATSATTSARSFSGLYG